MNPESQPKEKHITQLMVKILPFLGLVFVIVFFSIVTKGILLSLGNLSTLMNSCFLVMIGAIGATFVYSNGGMDFSIGAQEGLCVVLSGIIISQDINNIWLAFLVCIGIGVFSGLFIGVIREFLGVSAFIVTVAASYIIKGIVSTILLSTRVIFPAEYAKYDNTALKIAVLVAVAVVCYLLFGYTKIGKMQKAIGNRREVVDASGINAKGYIILSHVILGVCVGLGSFFVTPRFNFVLPSVGQGYEMDVFIALLIGGMPLSGGSRASIRCAIVGSAIIAVLDNGFALWGVPGNIIQVVRAIVFIAIVILTTQGSLKGFIRNKNLWRYRNEEA